MWRLTPSLSEYVAHDLGSGALIHSAAVLRAAPQATLHPPPSPHPHDPRLSVWQSAIRTSAVTTPEPHYQFIKSGLSGIIRRNTGGEWQQSFRSSDSPNFWSCSISEPLFPMLKTNHLNVKSMGHMTSQHDQEANRDMFHNHNIQFLFQRAACTSGSLYTFKFKQQKVKILHNLNTSRKNNTHLFILKTGNKSYKMTRDLCRDKKIEKSEWTPSAPLLHHGCTFRWTYMWACQGNSLWGGKSSECDEKVSEECLLSQ